jgi:DnaK suppressor protein
MTKFQKGRSQRKRTSLKKVMEHTKQRELDIFRKTLRARQAELSDGRRSREALAIETSADEFDRIQHAQERDFAIGALDRESVRLREIRAALERIENGTFGICLNCEEEIGLKRLAAVPWTALCIACQEAAELIASDFQNDDEHRLRNAA